MDRRKFISASLILGLTQVMGLEQALAQLNHFQCADGEDRRLPFIDRAAKEISAVMSGQLNKETFLDNLRLQIYNYRVLETAQCFIDQNIKNFQIEKLFKQKLPGINGPDSVRSLKLQLFYIPSGMSHAPHGHSNLISMQTIIQGQLHVREYDRIPGTSTNNTIEITKKTDNIYAAGQTAVTTEKRRNVHWFGAVGSEPAIVLNFNLQGLYHKSELFEEADRKAQPNKDGNSESHARYYLDIATAKMTSPNRFIVNKIEQAEAESKYKNRPL